MRNTVTAQLGTAKLGLRNPELQNKTLLAGTTWKEQSRYTDKEVIKYSKNLKLKIFIVFCVS